MAKSYRQLVLKLKGKSIIPKDGVKYQDKTRTKQMKLKHLQRYQKNILNANIENIPNLLYELYSYLIKKQIIQDIDFLKREINTTLISIINAYMYDYPINETSTIKACIRKNYQARYSKNIDLIAATSKSLNISVEAILNSIVETTLYLEPLKTYNKRDFCNTKFLEKFKEQVEIAKTEFLLTDNKWE